MNPNIYIIDNNVGLFSQYIQNYGQSSSVPFFNPSYLWCKHTHRIVEKSPWLLSILKYFTLIKLNNLNMFFPLKKSTSHCVATLCCSTNASFAVGNGLYSFALQLVLHLFLDPWCNQLCLVHCTPMQVPMQNWVPSYPLLLQHGQPPSIGLTQF
jgi:hypothetical protein